MKIKLRYLSEDRDRHGNVRLYVRLPGKPKKRIRALPGTEAFLADYQAAISEKAKGNATGKSGTFDALCEAYYRSSSFKRLDKSTRDWRRRALGRVCASNGHKPVALMEPKHVRQLREELADRPVVANTRLKALKALFRWAVENEEVERDPARDIRLLRYAPTGHHPWSDEEIALFENRHAIGTKARLAMALLLHTAGRREDAVRLGRQHIRDGRIRFTQAKNEHLNPVRIDLPLSKALEKIVAATPCGDLTLLTNEYGRAFTPAGFGNKFRQWCDQAGLPQCSAHGLRKAAATRLAEAGASEHEIMAVTGHRTLSEVQRYTQAARRAGLADRGFAKLGHG